MAPTPDRAKAVEGYAQSVTARILRLRTQVDEAAIRASWADLATEAYALLSIGHPCIGIADQACVEQSGWSIEKCLKKGRCARKKRR